MYHTYARTNVVFILLVSGVEQLQQSLLYEGLLVERPLVLDDLNRHKLLLLEVVSLHNLRSNPRENDIIMMQLLYTLDYTIS